jgi:ectoine hydroxylase-related dioxygenase (phytanoyl-CoA dioxygenase family)
MTTDRYPKMIPPDILAVLGETGGRFLGFNVRIPTSLDEYYLPPDKRLYKPNQG